MSHGIPWLIFCETGDGWADGDVSQLGQPSPVSHVDEKPALHYNKYTCLQAVSLTNS